MTVMLKPGVYYENEWGVSLVAAYVSRFHRTHNPEDLDNGLLLMNVEWDEIKTMTTEQKLTYLYLFERK